MELELLQTVALLRDWPQARLRRGHVGTVVETLGDDRYLVEFSGKDGRAFALETLPGDALLPLRYEPLSD